MAVPTITNVDPVTGPAAGGQLVTLTGTNFKIPTLSYAVPTPSTITPTISVTIAGRAVREVRVISATEIRVLTDRFWHVDPRIDAFVASDIVLSNLDAVGVAIPGETVTSVGGYTYKRWELGAPRREPPTTRILQELMWALSIEVERNTYRATHVDYGEEGSEVTIAQGDLPSINIQLTIEKDYEYGAADNTPEEVDKGDGTFDLYEGARTVMLILEVLVAGGTAGEAEHLCSAVQDFVQVHPELLVAADPVLFPGEEDRHSLEIWRDPQQVGSPVNSGMVVFSMQLRVRGIMTMPDDPTLNVKPMLTATMSMQHMSDGVGDGTAIHTELLD